MDEVWSFEEEGGGGVGTAPGVAQSSENIASKAAFCSLEELLKDTLDS